jgi:hypothetical protein
MTLCSIGHQAILILYSQKLSTRPVLANRQFNEGGNQFLRYPRLVAGVEDRHLLSSRNSLNINPAGHHYLYHIHKVIFVTENATEMSEMYGNA